MSSLPICFNTRGSRDVFLVSGCSLSKEKDKQATPLKRLFGQCPVPDECRKQRSAHIENTQGNCASKVYAFGAESQSKGWPESSPEGEVAVASTLILDATSTAEVAQNARHTCKVERYCREGEATEKSKHVHLSVSSVNPPSSDFYSVWSVSDTGGQCRKRGANREFTFSCQCSRSFPSPPFY